MHKYHTYQNIINIIYNNFQILPDYKKENKLIYDHICDISYEEYILANMKKDDVVIMKDNFNYEITSKTKIRRDKIKKILKK